MSLDDTTRILVRVQVGARSDCGPVRAINEDAFACDESLGLYLVCDGMGGHQAGEIASRIAVDSVHGFIHRSREGDIEEWPFGIDPAMSLDANRLRNAISLANRRVWRTAQSSRALDGIPLAIELAAAHVRSFGLSEVAARLEHQLDVVDDGRRGGTAHQRTLRAAIQWSVDLLDDDDRRAFARLGTFAGRFDLASATAIASG